MKQFQLFVLGFVTLSFLSKYVNANMTHHFLSSSDSQQLNRENPELMSSQNVNLQLKESPGATTHLQLNEHTVYAIALNVLRFALNVGNELSEMAYFSKTEVFSPLSVMSALLLILAGAKGKSYQQLKQVFSFDMISTILNDPNYPQGLHQAFGTLLQDIEKQDTNLLPYFNVTKWRETLYNNHIRGKGQQSEMENNIQIIKIANGLFTQKGYNINPNYRDVITTIYKSEIKNLDFKRNSANAREYINIWVAEKTFNKIPTIINNAIPPSTNMILVSVLYFKGFWENSFFEVATAPDNFYPEGEQNPAIKVLFMATGGVFPYYESPLYDCRIIGLPYKGNLTTMYVIQPKNSSRAKLKEFQSKITPQIIEDLISKMAYRSAVVAFPKLHLSRQINFKEILLKFGVVDIFSNGVSDLSLIGTSLQQESPESLKLQNPNHPWSQGFLTNHNLVDRYNEKPLYFRSRFGEIDNFVADTNGTLNNTKNVPTTERNLLSDDLKEVNIKVEHTRKKRQTRNILSSLNLLEEERSKDSLRKSDLYVDDIMHKVDFEVNEQGTEAAAATLTYLKRSGTDVVFRAETPFLILVRHDPSKLLLFYAIINEPET